MAKLYFAKINVNSVINEINDEEIKDIHEKLFKAIDDKVDYVKEIPSKYIDEYGNIQDTTQKERYNFSQIERDKDDKVITGWIVRRMPIHIEEFDNKERISTPTVLKNTSMSTMFYLNCEKQIITFTTKGRFGYLQIIEAFENLFEKYIEGIGFKIILINNPFSIDETLVKMKKVHKVTSTVIPPNAANRAALEALFKEKSKELKEANVTTETTVWETDKKNENGINKKSSRFKGLVNLIKAFAEKGYGKTEIEGIGSNGNLIKFDSDEDAPYVEDILDVNKEDRETVINVSTQGIQNLAVKLTIDNLEKQDSAKKQNVGIKKKSGLSAGNKSGKKKTQTLVEGKSNKDDKK